MNSNHLWISGSQDLSGSQDVRRGNLSSPPKLTSWRVHFCGPPLLLLKSLALSSPRVHPTPTRLLSFSLTATVLRMSLLLLHIAVLSVCISVSVCLSLTNECS